MIDYFAVMQLLVLYDICNGPSWLVASGYLCGCHRLGAGSTIIIIIICKHEALCTG
jgi:hypothetical protein